MKKLVTLLVVMVIVFLGMGSSLSQENGTTPYYVNITSGYLNVRFGPSTSEDSFYKLYRGDKVDVISISNGWAYIVCGDSLGYVSEKYISLHKPSVTPKPQAPKTNVQMKDLKVKYVGILEKKTYAYDSRNNKRSIPTGLVSIFYIENGWAWIPFDRQIRRIKESSFSNILEVKDIDSDICDEPIICAYSTFFDTQSYNRVNNINVGASYLNVRIGPNEKFSFNGTLGARTPKKGYLMAGAFSNGKTIQAYGGGVCQLSSTIYAATRQLNFADVIRFPHNPDVKYLPLDMDATVNWNNVDFSFRNPYDFTIQIEPHVSKGMLTIIIRKVIPLPY
jgi:hypothetical protein